MEEKYNIMEDELVQLYQDDDITLVDFIEMHPEGWSDEFKSYCKDRGRDPDEECALDFLAMKNEALEKALEEGEA